jgi:TRAP-type C4-dicarboxylate transport system permease small subunit
MTSDPHQREEIDLLATSEGFGPAIPEAGFLGRVVNLGGWLFAAGIVAAAAILLVEVFSRYFFNNPTVWAHEVSIFLCAVAFIYGGLYCTARNSHIRVTILYDLLPPRARRVADVVISLVCATSALFFAYAAERLASRAVFAPDGAFRLEGTGSSWNPPTPGLIKAFIFVVMILLTIQFLVLAFNYARGSRSK